MTPAWLIGSTTAPSVCIIITSNQSKAGMHRKSKDSETIQLPLIARKPALTTNMALTMSIFLALHDDFGVKSRITMTSHHHHTLLDSFGFLNTSES